MPSTRDLSTIHVLAVEDDASGVALLGVLLRRLQINAYIDATGEHALHMALSMKPPPDVIFLDLKLPNGLTGFDVIKQLQAHDRLKDIPVIAVTAMDANTAIPLCKDAGFNGYIGKPIRRKSFVRYLQRILDGYAVWDVNWASAV